MTNFRQRLKEEGLLDGRGYVEKCILEYHPKFRSYIKGMKESSLIGVPSGYGIFLFGIFGSYTNLDAYYDFIGCVGIGLIGVSSYLRHRYYKKYLALSERVNENFDILKKGGVVDND